MIVVDANDTLTHDDDGHNGHNGDDGDSAGRDKLHILILMTTFEHNLEQSSRSSSSNGDNKSSFVYYIFRLALKELLVVVGVYTCHIVCSVLLGCVDVAMKTQRCMEIVDSTNVVLNLNNM